MATNAKSAVAPSEQQIVEGLDPLRAQCAARHDCITKSVLALPRFLRQLIRSRSTTAPDHAIPPGGIQKDV